MHVVEYRPHHYHHKLVPHLSRPRHHKLVQIVEHVPPVPVKFPPVKVPPLSYEQLSVLQVGKAPVKAPPISAALPLALPAPPVAPPISAPPAPSEPKRPDLMVAPSRPLVDPPLVRIGLASSGDTPLVDEEVWDGLG